MFALSLVALWLVSLVIAAVWVVRITLRLVVAVCLLTGAVCRDLMAGGTSRFRFGEAPCV